MTISLKVAVGFTLAVLAWFCGQTHSVLPRMNEYTAVVLQPIFDSMRLYGKEKKNEDPSTSSWRQYLVVLMASHNEIINQKPVNLNDKTWKKGLENNFNGRLKLLLNEKHNLPEFNPSRLLHGETNYIHNNMINPMLDAFQQKYGDTELPIILMYSFYIPCADVPDLGYSCSEELGVFATYNWNDFGLMLAYSDVFKNTNKNTAESYMYRGGIPTFHFENNGKLVADYVVHGAGDPHRWRTVTFLQVFFDCLDQAKVADGCLADDPQERKAILAFFLNNIAYICFKDKKFAWRRERANEISNCFNNFLQNKIGTKCNQCKSACAADKKKKAEQCLTKSAGDALVPGEPTDPFNPFSHTWSVSRDISLNLIFPDSPQNRRSKLNSAVSCKDKSLSLESLCTQ